jgi:hypothetical protein
MAAEFKVKVDQPRWLNIIRDKNRAVAGAAVGALAQAADDAVLEGRKQIAASGRFSDKLRRTIRVQDTWLTGLKARMRDAKAGGKPSLQAKALVFHTVGLAGVFEFGAKMQGPGKKLLWIPTNPRAPPAGRSGKALVSATIRGTPVLFDASDPKRDRKPLYIGVPTVRIEKKWHIIEIVKRHFQQIGTLFLNRLKDI